MTLYMTIIFIIIIIALILMQSSNLFSKTTIKTIAKSEFKAKSESPKKIVNSNALFSPGMFYSNPTGCPGFGC